MQRYVKNIATVVKYVLSPFSMMNVPVDNDGFLFSLWDKIICSNSNIIEERKSMRLIFHAAVMAWRSDQTNEIFWVFWESILNSQNYSFNSLKSSIKSLFHVISIDIDKHLRFGNTLTPHALNKVKIPLAMYLDYLLESDFIHFFIMNLDLLFEFRIIVNKLRIFSLFQVVYHLSDSLWTLWMVFWSKFVKEVVLIIQNYHKFFWNLIQDFWILDEIGI